MDGSIQHFAHAAMIITKIPVQQCDVTSNHWGTGINLLISENR
jgi:hypothetical protein